MKCEGCKYWSELIAKSVGGEIHALCLNTQSKHSGKYTSKDTTCVAFAAGEPIDNPRGK